jgi:hypothetical protein
MTTQQLRAIAAVAPEALVLIADAVDAARNLLDESTDAPVDEAPAFTLAWCALDAALSALDAHEVA